MDHVWTAGCAVYAYTQRGYGVYGQMLLLLMLASRSRTWWCEWRDVKVLPRSVGETGCGSIASHRPLFDFARPTLIATWAVNCPMFVSMRSSRLAVKRCPFAVCGLHSVSLSHACIYARFYILAYFAVLTAFIVCIEITFISDLCIKVAVDAYMTVWT